MTERPTIPGFVDLQVNGFRGVDFSGADLTEERFASACRDILMQGTAAFFPTLITSSMEVYERNLPVIARAMRLREFQGRLPGIHLEGPFISREPGAVGAHNPDLVKEPDPALLDRLLELAEGTVRLVTLAGELKGAAELVRRAVSKGVTVSLGHSLADDASVALMVSAGATALTHLGNGMPNMVHRHQNPLLTGMANDALSAMIIADGHHLPASLIRTILRAKGVDRTIVVSDASPAAGLPPGRRLILGNDAVIEPSGRIFSPVKQCLVGSSATMLRCMNHLASLGFLSPDELLKVGFFNPLRLVGLDADTLRGAGGVVYDEARRCFTLTERRPRDGKP